MTVLEVSIPQPPIDILLSPGWAPGPFCSAFSLVQGFHGEGQLTIPGIASGEQCGGSLPTAIYLRQISHHRDEV
jgi:hypothetical protein